jgi:hypothetical protein
MSSPYFYALFLSALVLSAHSEGRADVAGLGTPVMVDLTPMAFCQLRIGTQRLGTVADDGLGQPQVVGAGREDSSECLIE